MRRAVFAIPGDLATVTGGYLYERRLLEGLRDVGTDVTHLQLGSSFPHPSPGDHAHAVAELRAVDPATPIILDGFLFGSMDPAALRSLRSPVVGIVHHPLAHEEGLTVEQRTRLFHREHENLRRADAVLVPSPHTKRILVEEYGARDGLITVARPGTDRPDGAPRPDDPPLVLSVGIQHPRKGHDVLLRALALLTDLAWDAVIVGTPYDAAHVAELRRLVTELDLARRVQLRDAAPTDERDDLYWRASVFALATRYEGYGLVFDEALMRGLPIVSCRTGAVPETVPADAGLLVPPDDPLAFADALRTLLTDDDRLREMAAAAARAGERLPTWRDTASLAQRVIDALG